MLKKYRKVKHIGEELKALSGREEKKYRKEHGGDIAEYHETCKQVLELYPSGNIPKVENLEKHIASMRKERASDKIGSKIIQIVLLAVSIALKP